MHELAATKVCPVIYRRASDRDEILVFRHPAAGVQLVKGTVEPGEAPAVAAVRELAEESGLVNAVVDRDLGIWTSGYEGQIWQFFEMRVAEAIPERWVHRTVDGGGHDFSFYWHPVAESPGEDWHSVFRAALLYLARARRD